MPDNIFERDLNPENLAPLSDKYYELEKLKWETVKGYLSTEKNQKTELTKNERMIMPLLEIIAEHPYSTSDKLKYDHNNPFWINPTKENKIKQKILPMRIFLDRYYEMGISVDRKGRTEEKEILANTLSGNSTIPVSTQPEQKSILMK